MRGEDNVVIGSSIESHGLQRKRIASGTVPSQVKFTMQSYRQKRVRSNRNINQVGIRVTKPEPPNVLGKSMTTKNQEHIRGNSLSYANGKMITVASSNAVDKSDKLLANKIARRP
jgi:hypothetical protein